MSTWTLFDEVDLTTLDFLSFGADMVTDLFDSSHWRRHDGDSVLEIFGSGLRLLHGELLPFGEITRIDLDESADDLVDAIDLFWDLLEILSYYNPLADDWDIDGLFDYLFGLFDRFIGSDGDDVMAGHGGNDELIGNAGTDRAEYDGARANFALSRTATGWQVNDQRGDEGRDTLSGIERLQFGDTRVALDLDGDAGIVARLIGTLFGPAALHDAALVGIGLAAADQGLDGPQLAALGVQSGLFAQAAGSHSNADFVRTVYRNVMGSAPAAAAQQYYQGLLDSGAMSQAELALLASQTAQAAAQIDLAGLTSTGLAYLAAEGGV